MKDKGVRHFALGVAYQRVAGESHAENMYHVLARNAFMRHLINSRGCRELFDKWSKLAGIYEPAAHVRAIRERLMALTDAEELAPDSATSLLNETFHAAMQFQTAILNHDIGLVQRAAARYVANELRLSWVWLVEELSHAWIHTVVSEAIDIQIDIQRRYEQAKIAAPEFELNLKHQQGESIQEAIERIKKEANALVDNLDAERKRRDIPKGRKSWHPEDVERYVEWFYRNKVKKETIYKIHTRGIDGEKLPAEFQFGRKEIRVGISYAKRWLDVGYSYLPENQGEG